MRKQYHLQNSEQGLFAWNVEKLLHLTKGLVPEAVALAEIRELDEAYWYDVGGEVATCRSVAEHMRLVVKAGLSYPIIIDPEGKLRQLGPDWRPKMAEPLGA